MSAPELQIRPVSSADASAFLSIMLECWRGSVREDSTAFRETLESLTPVLAGGGFGVIAYIDGTPIGCGRFVAVPRPVGDDRGWVEIKRVGILKAHRGQNLGAQVLDALEAEARSRNAGGGQLAVRSDQPRLVQFWESLGYRLAEDVALTTPNPLTSPPICMRKRFDALAI